MAERRLICPLCGLEYVPTDSLCQHGCPLRSSCGLTRCPGCDYEFPSDRPPTWLERLFGRTEPGDEAFCDHLASAAALETGERATVAMLLGSPQRRNRLAVFGLVPGADIRCLQRRPAFVLQVGETDLALDPDIVRTIVVERHEPIGRGDETAGAPAATSRRAGI